MKRTILMSILCGLFNLVYAQQNPQLSATFDKILAEQFSSTEPGVVALVSKNGKTFYRKAFGMANMELMLPMKTDNIFRIGSITKQFTAVAILQLIEKGKLHLKDEITKYISDYPTQGNAITIEHLLTHTSGIQDFTFIKDNWKRSAIDYTPTEMIAHFEDQPMRFTPGTKYEYSNSGYFLLGYIIEKITGKTYAAYLKENFFSPLGMNNSSYATNTGIIKNRAAGYSMNNKTMENASYISMSQPYAAGSILSTVDDLFKWNQALQTNKLINKESLHKALTKYKLNDGSSSNYGYGLRLGYVQESSSVWHGGLISGFKTMAIYLPGEDVYVAVLSNCDYKAPEDIAEKLASLAIGKPYERKVITLDNVTLTSYTGLYENARGQQSIISISDNQLYFQAGRGPKTPMKAFQKDKFFFIDDPMLTVEFPAKGQERTLIVHSRTANDTWIKTGKQAPSESGIKVDEKILETYVGEYEVNSDFTFEISKEQEKLFLQGKGQPRFEIFAEAENKFFLKVNGAQLEFLKDHAGKIFKAILNQGGRQTDAKKIK